MNGDRHGCDVHEKALRLGTQELVEGITAGEREWLDRHLEECAKCARAAAETHGALLALRAVAEPLPPGLARRTQARVYLRAREFKGRRKGQWAAWAACGVSWAAGIASAPYVWRGCEWLGVHAGVPSLIWKMGFALWWTVPALLAAVALLVERSDEGYRAR